MKICAYSTCNDLYIQNSIVSLLSVKKWNPNIDLYIITSNLSDKDREFAARYKINVIEEDLSSKFHTSFSYPVECYYLFAGQKIFLERGYDYSIYIDGDIYCNSSITINWPKIKYFAGVSLGSTKDILGKDLDKINKIWEIQSVPDYRIQTGVLIFNNKSLTKIDLLGKIAKLYSESIAHSIPRTGDDSLFSLFQLVHQEVKPLILDENYNLILYYSKSQANLDYLRYAENKILECVFYHFTCKVNKPWQTISSVNFTSYTEK